MPLFNNFPFSNLHELNLDWVISKLKDVEKAQTAAETIVPLVDAAEDYCTRAETAANTADTQRGLAAGFATQAYDYSVEAKNYRNSASGYATSASTDATNAHNDALAAAGSASDAHDDAVAAAGSAADAHDDAVAAAGSASDAHTDALAAAADADRAQLYGASTGVMCFNGEVSAQSAMDVAAGYGTYAFIYFCDNTANSSGIHIIRHKSGNFKNRNLLTNGGAAMPVSLTQSGTDVHVYASIADGNMYFILIGYADA